ncbi:hypothetical protein HOY82DRAFT_482959 [Tuber indicum]|nr:hypothetical protein HOY82DRAFT_482959 [Tuber indicum]
MLKSIISLCLAVHMGSAHWPGHEREGITRILVRQNTNNTMTARPPPPATATPTLTTSPPPTQTSPPSNTIDPSSSPSTSASPPTSSNTIDPSSSPSTSASPPTSSNTIDPSSSPSTSASPPTSSNTIDPSSSPSTSASPPTSSNTIDPSSSPSTSASPPTSSSTSSSTQSKLSSTSPPQPSSTRPGPTSFPSVDGDSVAPKDARPIKTTHGSFTAIISNNPVILDYSGEVLPLSPLQYGHTPMPSSFKYSVLAALAGDDQTKPFGDLLALAPSVFEGLDGGKKYYIFAPTAEFVVEFFKDHQAEPNRHVRRKQLVDPYTRQQFVEKPKEGPDIKEESRTLRTTLVGEIKYVDLGPGEASRVVSNPVPGGDGKVRITSGFGNSTLVYAEDIPFDGGVIRKCDGFFTLPRALETVFASTNGRLWSTALEKAGILRDLSEQRKATIFTVEDDKLDEANLPGKDELNRLIHDGLSYEPDLRDGTCLGTRDDGRLSIIRNGDGMFVNGVRITKANVIAKNCVIHYLEAIPPVATCVPSSAVSRAVIPKATILGLSAASLAVCLLM